MNIDFFDQTTLVNDEHLQLITELLTYAAKQEQVDEEAELSVSFIGDDEIQKLNKQYRGLDRSTDVLSFALEEETQDDINISGADIPTVLGDIIISVDKAKEQANDYNHSYSRELGFLALHGFLHLLGYDHMNQEDEQKMFSRQEEILNGFGLSREK